MGFMSLVASCGSGDHSRSERVRVPDEEQRRRLVTSYRIFNALGVFLRPEANSDRRSELAERSAPIARLEIGHIGNYKFHAVTPRMQPLGAWRTTMREPDPFLILFSLAMVVWPMFLASWARPGLAGSACFMSISAVTFAVSGGKFASETAFAVLWSGSMLLAGLSRVADGLDILRERIGKPLLIRIAPDDADYSPPPGGWLSTRDAVSKTAPISPPPGGWTTDLDLRRDPPLD